MGSTTIEYRLLPGTAACVGRSGGHAVIADRPEGTAKGMGLGFNGGELLALAIGGCFCNDMQAISGEMGLAIVDLRVTVSVDFAGAPSRATGAEMIVECVLEEEADPAELIGRAKALTTIGNSVREGFPLAIAAASAA